MIKKKVSVRTKEVEVIDNDIKPVRGRPKTKFVDTEQTVPSLPSSRVFSVSIESTKSVSIRVSNIIRLKLNGSDISRLEKYITEHKGLIGGEQDTKLMGYASEWGTEIQEQESQVSQLSHNSLLKSQVHSKVHSNSQVQVKGQVNSQVHSQVQSSQVNSHCQDQSQEVLRGFTGLESFIKLKSVAGPPMVVSSEEKTNRKDLIINSGIKRTSQEPLSVFSESWPVSSPYACWYCCHNFDTTPVGIPAILTNHVFRCYGNFCSYNCARRYLCPLKDDEDDMASMQSSNDIFKGDDQGEKLQLLELLYHLETGADLDEPIKTAPRRLILKMFGGNKTIDEFRRSFKTNTTYHTFKMPLASMAYHMEECTDTKTDTRRKLRNMSLDVARLEQAYNDLMKEKKNNKLSVQKILTRGEM
jgi:hypothetical protein